MGRCRPRHLVLGLVALVAVLWSASAAGSEAAPPARLRGAVTAAGHAPDATGWRVEHPTQGRYVVVVPATETTFDVTTWDAAADVTIIPLGDGATEVRFTDHRQAPIDTDFQFVATMAP